jgi:hypothetical protein
MSDPVSQTAALTKVVTPSVSGTTPFLGQPATAETLRNVGESQSLPGIVETLSDKQSHAEEPAAGAPSWMCPNTATRGLRCLITRSSPLSPAS